MNETDKPRPYITEAALSRRPYTPPEFLVEHLIPKSQIVLMAAESGSNKTAFSLHMCAALTARAEVGRRFKTSWDGRKIVYLNGEMSEFLIARYAREARLGLGREPSDCVVFAGETGVTRSMVYSRSEAAPQFIESLLQEHNPCLVVIDTLRELTDGLDENDAKTVRPFFRMLSRLRDKFDCAFLVLHHLRKQQQFNTIWERIAGSSEFRNAPDVVIGLRGQPLETLTLIKTRTPIDGCGNRTEFPVRAALVGDGAERRSMFEVLSPGQKGARTDSHIEQIIERLQAGNVLSREDLDAKTGSGWKALRVLLKSGKVVAAEPPSLARRGRGRPALYYRLNTASPMLEAA